MGITTSLCQGYRTLANLPHTLTHAAALDTKQESRKTARRSQSCGSELVSCVHDNEVLYADISWRPPKPTVQMIECDEYPWASSEEGGNWMPANQQSRLCVPRVQNNHGGQCISMLSDIQSNIGQMDPNKDAKDRKDVWVPWGKSTQQKVWYTEDKINGVNNSMTEYEVKQPVPVGWSEAEWKKLGHSDKLSWVYKRNYTFDIVDDASDGTDLWGASSVQVIDPAETIRNPTGYGSVLCAVNIFDQNTYYKNPRDSKNREWNALCYKNPIGIRKFHI